MKDLIKEIEELKLKTHTEETEYRFGFRDGNNTCVVSVKHILNQYNIITAPKQIKLSEILGNLKLQIEEPENLIKIQFNREINCIGYGEYDGNWWQNTWAPLVKFNKDLTIKNICIKLQDNIKWLYTLWIAGTEIVDDMEKEVEEDE